MRLRYVTGPAYAVVRAGAVVVLPEKVSPELVDELWRALDGGAGVVPLLEVLTGSFGASLASLPPFAIAVVRDGRVQVAVRGTTSVHVGTLAGDRVGVTGESVTTWTERTFDDVAELVVGAGTVDADGDLADGRGLPLEAGVVLASSVGVFLVERDRVDPRATPAAATSWPGRAVESAPAVHAVPAVTPPVASVPVTAPEPVAGPVDASAPESVPGPEIATGPAFEPVPDVAASPDAAASPDEDVAADLGPSVAEPPLEETSGYGHLWGSTVHRGVEAAAVRPEEEDEAEADAPAPGASEPAASERGGSEPGGSEPGAARSGVAGGGEASFDVASSEASPETIAPEPGPETIAAETVAPETQTPDGPGDDVDGSTVLSSAIADLRAAATPAVQEAPAGAPPGPAFAPSPVAGRPTILARTCPGGHPNPPQRDDCARCGQPLVGEARQVPRPPLGVMAVSGGARITLDRPVVVGRRPRSPRSTGDDLPRLVTVPSPEQDISRSHVEVRLEGWHVLVSDMSTTNGTTLLRAGQPPMRLHPGEPVLVVSSDVLDLGDGVTLTFEGIV